MTPESIEGLEFPAEVRVLVKAALAEIDGAEAMALVAGSIGPPPDDPGALPEAA